MNAEAIDDDDDDDEARMGKLTCKRLLKMVLVMAAVSVGACDDTPCDPWQMSMQGLCIGEEPVDAAPPAAKPDAAPPSDGDTDAGAAASLVGKLCMADTDCTGDTNTCVKAFDPATFTLSAEGYCSRTGCKTAGTACPEGWACEAPPFPGVPDHCKRP